MKGGEVLGIEGGKGKKDEEMGVREKERGQ